MHIQSSSVFPEVLIITPKIFTDSRGFFYESFNDYNYYYKINNEPVKNNSLLNISEKFVQDNISRSIRHTLRGLHYQAIQPQAKLVSVIRGEVFDVMVDIRENSPTRGQWFGQILNDQNHIQIYIPKGFAHGFLVLSDTADFMYKCTDYYCPEGERGIIFSDPDINISWPINNINQVILSPKDKSYPLLKNINLLKIIN